ncbi:putative phage related protein [Wolbachia endosymbiont of Culex quinquefasciatus JHB]|uniref:hypothetical protein n=1 Tax=Wolbachia endosymbiont of Culex quinquefasciatus TaxID=263437 RepID=UPI00016DA81A|nr:hypothetical protein [Wolbachia endosymbiont of Culex quinquefasciatus]EEB55223.1 putative phage related protein [Wolbachia endosymbiont of Culex quinquefasciatus JHB]EEB55445.1 putative phage related protein [Wolbachia endosymbiont of Culex quinquefasciatus JHB]EEB56075.1 putative phage related protein [Wolbachia endosymbiont of Culex quinquefasciatus JHB]CAQ54551.1 Putative phage related protein [Wolbachia endosymbiont of Culex quinquefasciatus Pel]CAQ55433.1 Putative phage related protei
MKEAIYQRIKDLAANSTPDQLAYLAKSLELIADKKAISDIVQMAKIKEIIDALQKRLKDLAENSTPDQLAYLAKALESIIDKSAVSEIVQMTDGKLKELLDSAKKHLTDLDNKKASSLAVISESEKQLLKRIDEKGTTNLSLLDTRKNANIAAINSVGNDHKDGLKGLVNNFRTVNDVPSGSSIMKEVRNRHMIEPGALPFLFGVLSRKNNYFGHGTFTTELGQWSSDVTKTDYMLQLLAGTHTYESYVSFYRPRQLSFLEGSKGTFIYGESYPRFMYDGFSEQFNMLKYPYAALGLIFVKNTSNVDISKTLNFVGSAMWYKDEVNYGGAGLFIGTPDKTNTRKSEISRITWTRIYQHEINSPEFIASGNILIPAGKTVAVLLYTSSNLHSEGERVGETPEFFASEHTYSTIYGQFIQWGIYNFRSNFLTTGLEVDVERTLRAWQCPGLDATHKIWN